MKKILIGLMLLSIIPVSSADYFMVGPGANGDCSSLIPRWSGNDAHSIIGILRIISVVYNKILTISNTSKNSVNKNIVDSKNNNAGKIRSIFQIA